MEEIQFYLEDAKETMEKSMVHYNLELAKIRAGRAMPSMLDSIQVIYYGAPTPLSQTASVSSPDARTLAIKPFERSILGEIEKAIKNSDLGLNPTNNGEIILLNIPALTEERRKDLVKQVKNQAEIAKITVRNIRKDTNEELKKLLKDGAPEDEIKSAEEKVQKLTDEYIAKVDHLTSAKEIDIMKV